MAATDNYQKQLLTIASLDHRQVVDRLRNFKGRFRLDFSEDYLKSQSTDKLRHILFAALTTNHKPA